MSDEMEARLWTKAAVLAVMVVAFLSGNATSLLVWWAGLWLGWDVVASLTRRGLKRMAN